MKIYISGPMTGLPEYNFPAFEAAEKHLADLGHQPISPHRNPPQESWEAYMRLDLPLVCKANALFMLPGWEKSRGARLERFIAGELGILVYDEMLAVLLASPVGHLGQLVQMADFPELDW